jgi:uncharacterized membrane protein
MARAAHVAQALAVAALALGYACLAHYTNVTPAAPAARAGAAGVTLALTPLAAAAGIAAWRSRHRRIAGAALLAAAAGVALAWPRLLSHYSLLYWVEHAGTQSLLGLAFARTLAPGCEPLCTRFARIVHGALEPAIERYTRALTRAWALFFFGLALASTFLYFSAPLPLWSAFANFVTGPLIGLMFIAEYLLRRRLLPHVAHAGILAGIAAYRAAPQSAAREH